MADPVLGAHAASALVVARGNDVDSRRQAFFSSDGKIVSISVRKIFISRENNNISFL